MIGFGQVLGHVLSRARQERDEYFRIDVLLDETDRSVSHREIASALVEAVDLVVVITIHHAATVTSETEQSPVVGVGVLEAQGLVGEWPISTCQSPYRARFPERSGVLLAHVGMSYYVSKMP